MHKNLMGTRIQFIDHRAHNALQFATVNHVHISVVKCVEMK